MGPERSKDAPSVSQLAYSLIYVLGRAVVDYYSLTQTSGALTLFTSASLHHKVAHHLGAHRGFGPGFESSTLSGSRHYDPA